MTATTAPLRFTLKLAKAVHKALVQGTDHGLEVASYHLSVSGPGTEPGRTYTVRLVHDDEGTYLAICPELPQVLVFEHSEPSALAAAHAAIKEAVAGHG